MPDYTNTDLFHSFWHGNGPLDVVEFKPFVVEGAGDINIKFKLRDRETNKLYLFTMPELTWAWGYDIREILQEADDEAPMGIFEEIDQ